MKKRSAALIVSIAMAVTLTACGGGSTQDSPSGDSKDTTLTIGSNADQPTSLDRFVNVGYGCDDLDYLIFDPLVNSDHKGNYTPGLAVEWDVSEDYLSYTFTLREDVTFSDGSKFTSADVAATFNRIITDDTLTDTGAWGNLESVDTPDEQTAVLNLSGVMPTFYDELYRVPIICAEALESDPEGYFINPTGTGAFTVDSFDQLSGNTVLRREMMRGGAGMRLIRRRQMLIS